MTTSEPTTEIVRVLHHIIDDEQELFGHTQVIVNIETIRNAADRLEAQEQTIAALTARAEQAEAREKAIIRCSECARLDVINSDIVYAQCKKYAFVFFPFEADTRETGCTHGERGLPQDGEGNDGSCQKV